MSNLFRGHGKTGALFSTRKTKEFCERQGCENSSGRFICGGCEDRCFCSKSCQQLDWEESHGTICPGKEGEKRKKPYFYYVKESFPSPSRFTQAQMDKEGPQSMNPPEDYYEITEFWK
jgi:hypothetical protein